jgi:hypothetical protein
MKKMKKIILIIALFVIFVDGKSQNGDFFNKVIDSLLVSISQLIRNDLLNDNIYVLERSWIGFGEIFILEVVFDTKTTYILRIFSVSDTMRKKFYKQGNSFNFYKVRAFGRYINEHYSFPYDSFEYFNYRFLLVPKKEESFRDGIYGEYKFKVTEKDISIIDRKIEILQDENSIMQKYNSNF